MQPRVWIDIAPLPPLPSKEKVKITPRVIVIDMGCSDEEEDSGVVVMDINPENTSKRERSQKASLPFISFYYVLIRT